MNKAEIERKQEKLPYDGLIIEHPETDASRNKVGGLLDVGVEDNMHSKHNEALTFAYELFTPLQLTYGQ
jgi:hypothetical protein